MRRLLRPLAGLRRRSTLLELLLAGLAGLLAVAGVAEAAPAAFGPLLPVVVVLQVLTLLHRRRRPIVPFAVSVLMTAVVVESSGVLALTSYALSRYDDRWRVRTVGGVVGVLAVTRPWTGPGLEDGVGRLATALVVVLLPGAVGAVVSARAQLMTALRERAERAEAERELMARDAVLTERTRIAREMHDAVGHRVSLMVLQAGAIEVASADRQRVEHLAGEVQRAGRQALDELRAMVGVLRGADGGEHAPLAPQAGLPELTRLVADSVAAGMAVELTGPPPGAPPVDPGVGRAAYRIVQEALTNAGRHAPGAATSVVVERPPGRLVVRVVNGPPPVRPVDPPGGGYGLTGLGERVRTLDGTLRAEPRLDGGFVVEAEVPA